MDSDGHIRLMCICPYPMRFQIPCRHELRISKTCFSEADVAIRYHQWYLIGMYDDMMLEKNQSTYSITHLGFAFSLGMTSNQVTPQDEPQDEVDMDMDIDDGSQEGPNPEDNPPLPLPHDTRLESARYKFMNLLSDAQEDFKKSEVEGRAWSGGWRV